MIVIQSKSAEGHPHRKFQGLLLLINNTMSIEGALNCSDLLSQSSLLLIPLLAMHFPTEINYLYEQIAL